MSAASAAATFYVSTIGSDSNPGSETKPFRTIQRAANIVNPGDTVIVENGIYMYSGGSASCFGKTIVCISRGGASGQLVTFKSRNKWGAKLDGQNGAAANGFAFGSGANYVRIQNFEIARLANASGGASGIEIYNGGSFSEILGNRIHNIGRVCTGTNNGQNGIYIERNNVLVDGNFIHDNGRFKPGQNGCNPPNLNWRNHDHGIYHSAGDDVTIRNNVIYNIQQGWSIQVYPYSRKRLNILNNTFAYSNLHPGKLGAIIIWGGMTFSDSNITNNIFYQVNTTAIWVGGGSPSLSNLRINNNIVSNGTILKAESGVNTGGITLSNNRQHVNPGLVNPGASDFHLQANSVAIDTGAVVPVPTDIDGRTRP
ncbi:MAG: right-handed parallel beta-helix repeat-containing protein, partial [Blastocatellia bacterium]